MLDCFIEYIGVLGCDVPAPESALYVNSLPGITLKQFEGLTTEEKTTFATLWDDIQLRARARLQSEARGLFGKKFKIASTKQGMSFGRKLADPTTPLSLSVAGTRRGFSSELDWWTDEEYKNSALLLHYIQTVSLYSSAPTPVILTVTDFDLKTVIYTQNYNLEIGWNEIPVNKTFEARNIFVSINSDVAPTYEMNLPASIENYDSCRSRVRGVEFNADFSGVTYGRNVYGVSAVMGVRCSWDPFMCANKDLFATSLWYLLGSELMNERIHSSRFNTYTTIDLKKAQDLKAQFDVMCLGGTYGDARYEGTLVQAIEGITLSEDDCCLECNNLFTIQESKNFF